MRRAAAFVLMGLIVSCGGGETMTVTSPAPTPTQSGPPNTVLLSSRTFTPAFLSVARGTTVTWRNSGETGRCTGFADQPAACDHNVVSADNLFNSHPACKGPGTPCMAANETFRYTFSTPGTFVYYCHVHAVCTQGACGGMAGRVVVT